jgi:hypothetical protein
MAPIMKGRECMDGRVFGSSGIVFPETKKLTGNLSTRRDGIWSDKIVFLFCFVICIIASEQSSIILSAHVPACIDSAHIESMSILNEHIEFV